jgi:hypothetical protein
MISIDGFVRETVCTNAPFLLAVLLEKLPIKIYFR